MNPLLVTVVAHWLAQPRPAFVDAHPWKFFDQGFGTSRQAYMLRVLLTLARQLGPPSRPLWLCGYGHAAAWPERGLQLIMKPAPEPSTTIPRLALLVYFDHSLHPRQYARPRGKRSTCSGEIAAYVREAESCETVSPDATRICLCCGVCTSHPPRSRLPHTGEQRGHTTLYCVTASPHTGSDVTAAYPSP
eukprot:3141686-Prymnesium_polylepis.1